MDGGRPPAWTGTTGHTADAGAPLEVQLGIYQAEGAPAPNNGETQYGAGTVPSVGQHVGRQVRLGAGNALVPRPLVGHREQAPYAPGDRVLRERRIGELTQLLQ
jgi:hypothetical protein